MWQRIQSWSLILVHTHNGAFGAPTSNPVAWRLLFTIYTYNLAFITGPHINACAGWSPWYTPSAAVSHGARHWVALRGEERGLLVMGVSSCQLGVCRCLARLNIVLRGEAVSCATLGMHIRIHKSNYIRNCRKLGALHPNTHKRGTSSFRLLPITIEHFSSLHHPHCATPVVPPLPLPMQSAACPHHHGPPDTDAVRRRQRRRRHCREPRISAL